MPKSLVDDSKSEKSEEKEKGDKPDFVNRNEGVSVWINEGENSGKYLSVSLPLGLGTVNVFRNEDKGGE